MIDDQGENLGDGVGRLPFRDAELLSDLGDPVLPDHLLEIRA